MGTSTISFYRGAQIEKPIYRPENLISKAICMHFEYK